MTARDEIREQIVEILKSLAEIDGVSIETSSEEKTIYVKFGTFHSLDFRFIWRGDHFTGHSLTKKSQRAGRAVISIRSPLEATQFVAAYSALLNLRARRREG